jgi:hypothetical protein
MAPVTEAIWKSFSSAAFGALLAWGTLGRAPFPPGRPAAAIATASRAGLVLLLSVGALAALGFFQAEDRAALLRMRSRLRTRAAAVAVVEATEGSS